MHNLHLCVIRAETAEEAESEVKMAIGLWGDSNNWRAICGSVSEDDDLHDTGEGGYSPTATGLVTIAQINAWFGRLISEPYRSQDKAQAALRQLASGQAVSDRLLIVTAECYMRHLWEVDRARRLSTDPDVLKQVFYEGRFDVVGVTHFGDLNRVTRVGGLERPQPSKRFVVFVDMHS